VIVPNLLKLLERLGSIENDWGFVLWKGFDLAEPSPPGIQSMSLVYLRPYSVPWWWNCVSVNSESVWKIVTSPRDGISGERKACWVKPKTVTIHIPIVLEGIETAMSSKEERLSRLEESAAVTSCIYSSMKRDYPWKAWSTVHITELFNQMRFVLIDGSR